MRRDSFKWVAYFIC